MDTDDLDELNRLSDATADLAPRAELTARVMSAVADAEAESDPWVASTSELWASIAERTAELSPSPQFSANVMAAIHQAKAENEHEPLELLAARTRHLEPRAGFEDRVMRRVRRVPARPARGLGEGVAKSGIKALFAAAAVAAAAMFYASYSEKSLEADVLASVDTVEMGD